MQTLCVFLGLIFSGIINFLKVYGAVLLVVVLCVCGVCISLFGITSTSFAYVFISYYITYMFIALFSIVIICLFSIEIYDKCYWTWQKAKYIVKDNIADKNKKFGWMRKLLD